MKKIIIAGVLMSAAASGARAQSSVTLYGIISDGIGYVSNEGGHRFIGAIQNHIQPSRFGFRGQEDLGGGISAIFTLENGFGPLDGTLSNGGRLFGRQAFVGLSSRTIGTATLGRQYDNLVDFLKPYESAALFGAISAHIGDNDNVFDAFRENNTIKYVTPMYRGFQAGAMYGASNKAGDFSDNRSYSAGASCAGGGLSMGAAYLHLNRPADATNTSGSVSLDYSGPFKTSIVNPAAGVDVQENFGIGASYTVKVIQISALVTRSNFRYLDHTSLHLNNYEASVIYNLSASWQFGAGYAFTDGKYGATGTQPKWHQGVIGIDYFLSKRTDLDLVSIYQRAAGDATTTNIFSLPASTSKSQLYVGLGIRHKF